MITHAQLLILRDEVASELHWHLRPVGLEEHARERANNMVAWLQMYDPEEDPPLVDAVEATLLSILNFVPNKDHARPHLRRVAEELIPIIRKHLSG